MSLDASRGLAMLLVFAAHFADAYLTRTGPSWLSDSMKSATVVSTPTFVFISGLLLGYLYQKAPERFGETRTKLFDRGLFLLVVAHPIIVLANAAFWGSLRGSAKILYITDVLGLAFLVGPLLVDRVRPLPRAVLGAVIYAGSTVAACTLHPHGLTWHLLDELMVGGNFGAWPTHMKYVFPILPWFGVYLMATPIGQLVRDQIALGRQGQAGTTLLSIGALGGSMGVCCHTVIPVLMGAAWKRGLVAHEVTAFSAKLPPSPVFLLYNAGIGLCLMGALIWLESRGRFSSFLRALSYLGQSSLFAFVAQYFVYYSLLVVLHPHFTWLWPAMLMGTVAPIWYLSALWSKGNLNRFLTVGYGRYWTLPSPSALVDLLLGSRRASL